MEAKMADVVDVVFPSGRQERALSNPFAESFRKAFPHNEVLRASKANRVFAAKRTGMCDAFYLVLLPLPGCERHGTRRWRGRRLAAVKRS